MSASAAFAEVLTVNAFSQSEDLIAVGSAGFIVRIDPQWSGRRAIVDPWGKPVEEFARTFARIERCIDEVVRAVSLAGS